MSDEPHPGKHFVSVAPGFERLDSKVGICLNPASDVLADRLDPTMSIGVWVLAGGDVFGVLVPVVQGRLLVARVESSVSGEDCLHVLLRHRLLLEAEVGEGAVTVK